MRPFPAAGYLRWRRRQTAVSVYAILDKSSYRRLFARLSAGPPQRPHPGTPKMTATVARPRVANLVGSLTRRQLGTGAAAAAASLALGGSAARAAGSVNVMAYDGFIPPTFKRQFESDSGVEVKIRPAASQAPELSLMIAERPQPQSDIATVAGHRLHQFVEADLLAPIDVSRLKNWGKLNPIYAKAEWLTVTGEIMGAPLAIGSERLIANVDKAGRPDSWGAMFDPKFKGRTTYSIEDFLQCVMAYQGADGTFMAYLNKPDGAQKAVNAARDLLIKEKSQVAKYYETGSELQQLMVSEEVVLAQGYAGTLASLILAGKPIELIVPKEGSFAFAYTFALVKGSPNPDNAYRLLDALLGYPGISAALTRSSGYTTTFADAGEGLSEAERKAYGLPPDALERLKFFRYEGQSLSSALIDKAVEEVKAA